MRILSPYEKNQLTKYNIPEDKLLDSEMPVEYLTGFVEFCKFEFIVTPDVLIPRPETEELIQIALDKAEGIYKKKKETLNIVDVGTGSGAIAVCLASKLTNLKIPFTLTGLDISSEAIKVAKKNHKRTNPSLPITFSNSDLLDGYKSEKKIDLIIANLPYIPSDRIPNLDESVKDFEPHLALDGGKDGLDLVRTLLEQAKTKITKESLILLELDITHDKDKAKEFSKDWDITILPDLGEGVYFWLLKLI